MGVTGTRLDLWSTQEVHKFPCMTCITENVSTNTITAHHTSLCHTGHNRPNGDRRQTHAYPRQRFFPDSFRHAGKAHEDDYYHKCDHFQSAWKSLICIHAHDHLTWNNKFSKMRWCYKRVIEHTKILCRGSECLPSMCGKAGCTSKLLKVYLLSSKILFRNKWINTQNKNSTKSCSEIFSNKS